MCINRYHTQQWHKSHRLPKKLYPNKVIHMKFSINNNTLCSKNKTVLAKIKETLIVEHYLSFFLLTYSEWRIDCFTDWLIFSYLLYPQVQRGRMEADYYNGNSSESTTLKKGNYNLYIFSFYSTGHEHVASPISRNPLKNTIASRINLKSTNSMTN